MVYNILLFSLVVYGISNMLVYASGPFRMFEKYRDFMDTMPSNIGEGAHCMICTPTQVAIVLSLIDVFTYGVTFTPGNLITDDNSSLWLLALIIDGGLGSGIAWLLHTAQEALERTNKEEEII